MIPMTRKAQFDENKYIKKWEDPTTVLTGKIIYDPDKNIWVEIGEEKSSGPMGKVNVAKFKDGDQK